MHCCRRCPPPHLSRGHASDRPWCLSGFVLTRPAGPSSSGYRAAVVGYPGPTVGVMETAQILARPSSCMHALTRPTAAPLLASGVPAVSLDVLHVLNSQSWWRRCNSVSVQPWIEISFPFPKSHGPWDGFQPHLCAWAAHRCLVLGSPGGGWNMQACLGQSLFWNLQRRGPEGGVRGCHGAHPSLHAT